MFTLHTSKIFGHTSKRSKKFDSLQALLKSLNDIEKAGFYAIKEDGQEILHICIKPHALATSKISIKSTASLMADRRLMVKSQMHSLLDSIKRLKPAIAEMVDELIAKEKQ